LIRSILSARARYQRPTQEKAQRIAANVAKLPELLRGSPQLSEA
jgi:hypothetical protein